MQQGFGHAKVTRYLHSQVKPNVEVLVIESDQEEDGIVDSVSDDEIPTSSTKFSTSISPKFQFEPNHTSTQLPINLYPSAQSVNVQNEKRLPELTPAPPADFAAVSIEYLENLVPSPIISTPANLVRKPDANSVKIPTTRRPYQPPTLQTKQRRYNTYRAPPKKTIKVGPIDKFTEKSTKIQINTKNSSSKKTRKGPVFKSGQISVRQPKRTRKGAVNKKIATLQEDQAEIDARTEKLTVQGIPFKVASGPDYPTRHIEIHEEPTLGEAQGVDEILAQLEDWVKCCQEIGPSKKSLNRLTEFLLENVEIGDLKLVHDVLWWWKNLIEGEKQIEIVWLDPFRQTFDFVQTEIENLHGAEISLSP